MSDDLDDLLEKQAQDVLKQTSLEATRDSFCELLEVILLFNGGEEELGRFAAVVPPFRMVAEDLQDLEVLREFEWWLGGRHHQERLGRLMVTMALIDMLVEETKGDKWDVVAALVRRMREYPMTEAQD